MSGTFVQSTVINSADTSPITLSSTGAGHQLILYAVADSTITSSPSGAGGQWSLIESYYSSNNNSTLNLWWNSSITGGTSNVALGWSSDPGNAGAVWLGEFTGLNAVSTTSTPVDSSNMTCTAASITPNVGDFVLQVGNFQKYVTTQPSSPWVTQNGAQWYGNADVQNPLAWQFATSTTALTASWTQNAFGYYVSIGASFTTFAPGNFLF